LPPNNVPSLGMLFLLGLPRFGLALIDLHSLVLDCSLVPSDEGTLGSILFNLEFISFC
jgi:hypothetical protein